MSGRKLDAPLAVQMASLKKTMQNRDRRRNTDRAQKEREADDGAPATAQRRKAGSHLLSNATGGVRLGSCPVSGIAAGIAEPRVLRCVLCQATFKSVAEEQQHLAGPAHRKALLRQQTEQEHKTRLAKGRDAAHSAVEAAQWSSPAAQATSEGLSQPVNRQTTKVPPVAMTSAASGSLHHQKAGQSNLRQAKDQAAAAAKIPKQTHADLVAQMRQADEPLSVEGEASGGHGLGLQYIVQRRSIRRCWFCRLGTTKLESWCFRRNHPFASSSCCKPSCSIPST
ncbi:TPA: hypothetical protein ACH3X1_009949 [Trebouxia sp. C0004]